MTIKAVLWDVDGTLIDSEPLHLRSLLATCQRYGVNVSDLPADEFVGVDIVGVWEILKERHPVDLDMDDWISMVDRHYAEGASSLQPMPGASQVVKDIDNLGIRQVAVSNSGRRVVDANLELLGVGSMLEFSLSLDDVAEGKPSPFPYQLALDRLGLDGSEALAVEDSPSGYRSATEAGIQVAAFRNPVLGAAINLNELSQLLEYLKSGKNRG